jgi:hypothetical protein
MPVASSSAIHQTRSSTSLPSRINVITHSNSICALTHHLTQLRTTFPPHLRATLTSNSSRSTRPHRPCRRHRPGGPQGQGAGGAASAATTSAPGAQLLPGSQPALHHHPNSPLTYFRLGKCSHRVQLNALPTWPRSLTDTGGPSLPLAARTWSCTVFYLHICLARSTSAFVWCHSCFLPRGLPDATT